MSDDWTPQDSEQYRALADAAVPARAEQVAALLTLIPYGADDVFQVVELSPGEGYLADALLTVFPSATLTALEYEPTMQEISRERLAPHGERARVIPFDIRSEDWYPHLDGAGVVLGSLALHHVDGAGKRAVFAAVKDRIDSQGALLLADLVLPTRPEARELFRATWDMAVNQQGAEDAVRLFHEERWNYYRHPGPYDQPSALFEQLIWLRHAGFASADCYWMRAGHAVYGGYLSSRAEGERLPYSHARMIAEAVLLTEDDDHAG